MNNHFHPVIRDKDGNRPEFLADLNRLSDGIRSATRTVQVQEGQRLE
ncbi:MAG: hypothetical protein AAGF12_24960 [Myxococcota bacterium]